MDLTPSEEQEAIRESARELFEKKCPMSLVRKMAADPAGHPKELWREMAESGLMGVPFPEASGGMDGNLVDLGVLLEEMGRFRVPGPFFGTVVLGGLPIQTFGTDKQKAEYVPAIAAGERILAYAESESGSWEPESIRLDANRTGDAYILNGEKLFVPYAHAADELLVAARSAGHGLEGLTLLLVDAKAPGLTCTPLETIDYDHQQKVAFKDVKVPKANVLGEEGQGAKIVQAIHAWGAAAKSVEMVGGAQRVLDMSLEYAKTRTQFDRPIGSFQAVQHHCANMAVDVVGSRFIAFEACWRLSEGLDAAKEVAMAKAWVSDAYRRVCALGHQIHGAIGFTEEHDLHFYFRHASAAELAFGDGDYHRERLCRELGF